MNKKMEDNLCKLYLFVPTMNDNKLRGFIVFHAWVMKMALHMEINDMQMLQMDI